jgi:hypothetical protein
LFALTIVAAWAVPTSESAVTKNVATANRGIRNLGIAPLMVHFLRGG